MCLRFAKPGLPGNMAAYVWAAGPTLLTVFYLRVTLVDDGCETIDGSAVCPLGVPYLKVSRHSVPALDVPCISRHASRG